MVAREEAVPTQRMAVYFCLLVRMFNTGNHLNEDATAALAAIDIGDSTNITSGTTYRLSCINTFIFVNTKETPELLRDGHIVLLI